MAGTIEARFVRQNSISFIVMLEIVITAGRICNCKKISFSTFEKVNFFSKFMNVGSRLKATSYILNSLWKFMRRLQLARGFYYILKIFLLNKSNKLLVEITVNGSLFLARENYVNFERIIFL